MIDKEVIAGERTRNLEGNNPDLTKTQHELLYKLIRISEENKELLNKILHKEN